MGAWIERLLAKLARQLSFVRTEPSAHGKPLSYAHETGSELACWAVSSGISDPKQGVPDNAASSYSEEVSAICRTLQPGSCDAKGLDIFEYRSTGHTQRGEGPNPVRRCVHWYRRAWAHVSRSDRSVRHGTAQSRHLERRLGPLFRLSPRRHLDHGIQSYALERHRRRRPARCPRDAWDRTRAHRARTSG